MANTITDTQLKRGLKDLIKKSKSDKVVKFSTEALFVIQKQKRRIEFLEGQVDNYQKADRQAMIGSLDV